jgi:hypothetical protein
MERISLRAAYAVAALLLCVATGCASGSSSMTPGAPQSTASPAKIRVINGTSDVRSISVSIPEAAAIANVTYATVVPPAYQSLPSGDVTTLTVQPDTAAAMTCVTPYRLTAGGFYTLVVAGSVQSPRGSNQGLQCQLFFENYVPVDPGHHEIMFHYASPALFNTGVPVLQFGHYDPATQTVAAGTPVKALTHDGNAPFVAFLASTTNTAAGIVQKADAPPTASTQVGYYVAPAATPDPTAAMVQTVVLPSNAVLGAGPASARPDPNNFFPFANSMTFSLYAIDPAAGSTAPVYLVGVMD